MKNRKEIQWISAITSAAIITSACVSGAVMPMQTQAATAAKVIYENDFESDASDFTGRGGVEKLELTSEDAHAGSSSMLVTEKTASWNGPQFRLDDGICTAGVEYLVSAAVKTKWYSDIQMSLEYADSAGERHYNTLAKTHSDNNWVTFEDIKVSFADDVQNVYVYFECSDKGAPFYLDDFSIKTAPEHDIETDIVSLKKVYANHFKLGTAVTASELAPTATKNLINKHFNSITPGNELKPDALLNAAKTKTLAYVAETGDDTNPMIDLAPARSILNFARDNGISVRGHVLVWHSQTPDWFFRKNFEDNGEWVDQETMLKRMENYIKNVFTAVKEEYPDVDFYAWDVVNEAWLDGGTPRTGGTQAENPNYSGWTKVFGDNSFIPYAFEYAKKYAPEGCKLYYNDFNEYIDAKTNAICNMANELKEKNLIDGIGLQSHLDVGFPTVSQYEKAMKKFVETGLDIQVTELDITTKDHSESGMATQAQMYSDIMDICVKYADSISAVVFWGTTDDRSWRDWGNPLLFNGDYTAKESFYSIVDGLEEVDPIVTTPTTTEGTEAEHKVYSVHIQQEPDKTVYQIGEELDLTGGIAGAYVTIYEGGTTAEGCTTSIPFTDTNYFTIDDSEFDNTKPGTYTIYLCHHDAKKAFTVTVVGDEPTVPGTTTTTETKGTLLGDVNLDGIISLTDVVILNKNLGNLTGDAKVNANCYEDDVIDLKDAQALLQRIAGIIHELPYRAD